MQSLRYKTLYNWLVVACCLLFSVAVTAQSAPVTELDRIVAVVDEDVILKSELDDAVARIRAQLDQQASDLPSDEAIQRQVLDRLITKKLELAAAARAGINISEELLAQTIGNIARRNQITLSEFRQTLAEEGISFRSFRDSIRNQLTSQRLLDQEVLQRIRATDQEVEAFLKQQGAGNDNGRSAYRLSHILIATPEGASPEELAAARDKTQQLVERLREGADFSSIALTESDGRQALEGGDLGWRPANQLPSLFADQVVNMSRGDISDPIPSASGFHIVKLVDFKGGDRNIIEQTRVRHILIKTNEVTSENDARRRLEQLRQRILGGDEFAPLARSNSNDAASAIKGGDLGWVTSGDLLPRFEQEMNSLAIGELSEPFRTDFGWHLVQVTDRREYDSTEEVRKAKARSAIRKRKFEEESILYLRRLKDEAYIDIRLDELS